MTSNRMPCRITDVHVPDDPQNAEVPTERELLTQQDEADDAAAMVEAENKRLKLQYIQQHGLPDIKWFSPHEAANLNIALAGVLEVDPPTRFTVRNVASVTAAHKILHDAINKVMDEVLEQ